jgi:hypothetical protein
VKRFLPWLLPILGCVAAALLLSAPPGLADAPRKSLIDDDTRTAIDRGLRFLAQTQNADGSWTSNAGIKVNEEYQITPGGENVHHVGVTALGILAFLAAGHVPERGPYGPVVDKAVEFVLASVQPDGFVHANATRMYSHAFATLALAEVYGMSRRPDVRAKLESAVEFTIKCQNDTGGWRYVPFTVDSDMSVTVCQMVALRAARNVGIRVPQMTIDRALSYVIRSAITEEGAGGRGADTGAFYYQPENTQFNRSSFSLAAAGLTTLFQAGLYDDASLASYIERRKIPKSPPPTIGETVKFMRWRYRDAQRKNRENSGRGSTGHYFYYYGNYYAAQAMYNVGGLEPRLWEDWYSMVRRDLLDAQVPYRTVGPDGGGSAGGPMTYWTSNVDTTHAFATSIALLILSMPFDYLPIHQK